MHSGAALVVGLIMLTLITVMVTSAFTMSSTDLKSVGNLQWRNEATAAANKAIEQVISSPFTNAPGAQQVDVDINNDGVTDLLPSPWRSLACVDQPQIAGLSAPPSSVLAGHGLFGVDERLHQTIWDIDATVTDLAGGADRRLQFTLRQGVARAPDPNPGTTR